jgi:hypothetical protein
MVVHTCNPSTQKQEDHEINEHHWQPGLHSEDLSRKADKQKAEKQ